ncbi:RNA polymerase sigma factor [Paenibacillus sp. NEAU-GSW1]|uniref:RNA polymerase sigma factor n=1 Tax=Paenibacillus sp. NEAU-GSW1 TaxID=2682486 RepID=UPI0012E232B2|nr:RNA polymerase sigma factor [Paenibacillus sp. NEAU-GSW1]MUT64728.1 sigma-70 family RNA polymerase sigma factor [Paenibacillus sp. NEAU-GSW1]
MKTDRELFEAYRLDVYRLCFYMLHDKNDAEDVCQDVFITALQSDRSGISQEKSWLLKIAMNRCKTFLDRRNRGARKEKLSFLKFRPRFSESTEEIIERKIHMTEVVQLLENLPIKIRCVMVLRFVNDLSLQDIAQALNIPVGTVKSRLNKGISSLKKDTDSATYFQEKESQMI